MTVPTGTSLGGIRLLRISCAADVLHSPEEVQDSNLFRNWLERFSPEWEIERVDVSATLAWAKEIRMIFMTATAIAPDGLRRVNAAFLRGSTVDILPIIVAPDGTEYVVFVEQPRVPAGQLCITTPAGMVDDGNVESTALKELAEEIGGDITWSKPQWLNRFATGSDLPMLVSPGGTDEDVQFCTVRANLTDQQMRALHGRIAGAAEEGERTTIHVVVLLGKALPYLARQGRPCLKSVMSLLLYQHARQQA